MRTLFGFRYKSKHKKWVAKIQKHLAKPKTMEAEQKRRELFSSVFPELQRFDDEPAWEGGPSRLSEEDALEQVGSPAEFSLGSSRRLPRVCAPIHSRRAMLTETIFIARLNGRA
jgi:hypothetical protein